MDVLLKIFGIRATDAQSIARSDVQFHGVNPVHVILAALLLGALVAWMYRRAGQDVPAWRRYVMAGLRAAFLLLILGLLLRPVLSVTFESSIRRSVLLLLDTSASMSQILDQRTEADDLKRLAIARDQLDPVRGLNQELNSTQGLVQTPRIDVVKAALKSGRLNLLSRIARGYDLSVFTFDKTLEEISGAAYRAEGGGNGDGQEPPAMSTAWVEKLSARGEQTAIGDAVREVISRKRGQPIAGIVLVTDGASNRGVQPLSAATLAAQDRVPLYVWGVGITSPRDIVVGNIFAQEVAFAKDEVPVTVRVRSTGMAGQSARLVVTLGDEKAERNVEFNADGEQVVTVSLTPKGPGNFEINAAIDPREDEVSRDNNRAIPQPIRVVDGKIKVLYVEQYPRWEFKYAQAVLMRDRRVQFKCVLVEGDPGIAQGENSPYLARFPETREELFKYDLLILGDVDPRYFTPGQLDAISEFVGRFGGAMVVLAGKRSMPNAYRRSAIEKMLPVELESLADSGGTGPVFSRPVKLELTPAGKASTMLRLSERELDSAGRWAAMPPIYWAAKVARAKPAAEVLVVDPDPTKASRYGKMPVIALQQYGLGQVLYMGTDNLWRWRKNVGDRYHSMIWGQITQRMALPHLLGATKRTQLTSDQKSYPTGAKVTIFARLYTEGFEPIREPMVRGAYSDESGSTRREVQLRPIPDQPGMYRGELVAPAVGNYTFQVDHDKAAKLEFAVTDPKVELAETAMNKAILTAMAQQSGGAFFREEDLFSLPDKLGERQEKQQSTLEVELWSSPFYFLLMLLVVTLEWVMRKMAQLK